MIALYAKIVAQAAITGNTSTDLSMIRFGNNITNATSIFKGENEVSKIYLGSTVVYEKGGEVITEIEGLAFRTVNGVSPRYQLPWTTADLGAMEFIAANKMDIDGTYPAGNGRVFGNDTNTGTNGLCVYFFQNTDSSTPALRVRYCGRQTSGVHASLGSGGVIAKAYTTNLSYDTLFNTVITNYESGTQLANNTINTKPQAAANSNALLLGQTNERNEFDFYGLTLWDANGVKLCEYVPALVGTDPCIYDKVTETYLKSLTAVDPDPIL